jgi:hypothetical protein
VAEGGSAHREGRSDGKKREQSTENHKNKQLSHCGRGYGHPFGGYEFSVAKIPKNMLFRNASEIQNDRFLIFYLGGPAPCGRRRAIRCTRFARAAPIPAATES